MRSFIRTVMLSGILALVAGYFLDLFKVEPPVEEVAIPQKNNIKKSSERRPASARPESPQAVHPYDWQVTASTADNSVFNQNTEITEQTEASSEVISGHDNSVDEATPMPLPRERAQIHHAGPSASASAPEIVSERKLDDPWLPPDGRPLFPSPPVGPELPRPEDPGRIEVPMGLSCFANVGPGVFSNPIQVDLSCNAVSEIKYCVQIGACCDPTSSGLSYSTPVVIGAQSGDICLSFFGQSADGKTSEVVQRLYTINPSHPDLQLSFSKIFYQTTQLAAFHYMRSNHSGRPNYVAGELNLKAHDPGPDGLNMECKEIVDDYASLTAPAPIFIFDPIDLGSVGVNDQLNIPLVRSKLEYGENFLTSYVVNYNPPDPLYSCSTTKLTLKDFEFFAAEVSHGETGTDEVREFQGSFVGYGFFEEESQIYRTPAGLAQDETDGQELRVGTFGIFY